MHCSVSRGRVQRLAVGHLGRCEVALIQVRLSAPAPDQAARRTMHLVVTGEGAVGACGEPDRSTLRDALRASPSSAQRPWRARLVGSRLVGVRPGGLAFDAGDRTCFLGSAGPGRSGALALVDEPVAEGPPVDEPRVDGAPAQESAAREAAERTQLEQAGRAIVAALLGAATAERRDRLRRALGKALARVDRRAAAVQADLDRIVAADAASERARLFVAEAARAPRGATKLEAVDWSSGEPRTIEMPLDPARTAKEQLDALFARARRLKHGARVAERRLADTRRAREALARVADALGSSATVDLGELEAAARSAAPRDLRLETSAGPDRPATSARAAGRGAGRAPHRTFIGPSGAPILVGRGAADNDALTFHVARPHHLWLHAKGRAGAHVVVPLDKGASCPADVLVEAAHLAAHYSDARDEAVVEVQYASRRHVRKPRGSAPGLVVVDREKVIVLRRRAELVAALLEGEVDRAG